MPKVNQTATSPAMIREIDRQRDLVNQIDLAFELWRGKQEAMSTLFNIKKQTSMYAIALKEQKWTPEELIHLLALTMTERHYEREQRKASEQFIRSIYPSWGKIADHVMTPKSGGPKVKVDRKQIAIDYTVVYICENKKLPSSDLLSLRVSEELVRMGSAQEVEDRNGKRAYSISSARDLLQDFNMMSEPNDDSD